MLVAVAGALAGCGPVRSTANILDAEVQIQAARTAGAEKKAPYEWTAANLYIEKAREEVGYSDYQAGVNFAVKASKLRRRGASEEGHGHHRGREAQPAGLPAPVREPENAGALLR